VAAAHMFEYQTRILRATAPEKHIHEPAQHQQRLVAESFEPAVPVTVWTPHGHKHLLLTHTHTYTYAYTV
jgi:hypothetical protein